MTLDQFRPGLEREGAEAFQRGKSKDENPYTRVPARLGGLGKAAWWSAGWTKAQAAEGRVM